MKRFVLGLITLFISSSVSAEEVLKLYPGFITKVRCEGRLFVSAIGNDALVRLESLPKELGCGVLLKPLSGSARTNLILETSTGTVRRVIAIAPSSESPRASDLEYRAKGDLE